MSILDSLNEDQNQQQLQLLIQQYQAIGQQLLTEQNPVMRPLLKKQQEQIAAQIKEIEARQKTVTEKEKPKRRLLGVDALPAVGVWRGREKLLSDLAKEFEDDCRNVIALLGQGGMGKSTLAAKLVEAAGIDPRSGEFSDKCGFDCAITFKAFKGASFNDVAEVLLSGLGVQEESESSQTVIKAIINALIRKRVLLVIDNLDVILRSPSNELAGHAISEDLGLLIDGLANSNHQSLIILTSRELPMDLAGVNPSRGKPHPFRVRVKQLSRLDLDCSVQVLRDYGLHALEANLAWAANRVEGHPFLLELLGRHYSSHSGNLKKCRQVLIRGAESLLEQQVNRQNEAACQLLWSLCVLRYPVDLWGLTFLRLFDANPQDERLVMDVIQFPEREITETESIVWQLIQASLIQRKPQEDHRDFWFSVTQAEELYQVLEKRQDFRRKKVARRFLEAKSEISPMLASLSPLVLLPLLPLLPAATLVALGAAAGVRFFGRSKEEAFKELSTLLVKTAFFWTLSKETCGQVLSHFDQANRLDILQRIGSLYEDRGDYREAKTFYKKAINLADASGNFQLVANLKSSLDEIEKESED
ncbi:MAG: AAA family ATPase [Cyanobacteria bacterium P01_C01_bin.89]